MAPSNETQSQSPQAEEMDLEELARKVVELLLRELTLENERIGKY
jgi:hypothetical protein